MLSSIRSYAAEALRNAFGADIGALELEFKNAPPAMGDTALCCASLGKFLKVAPEEIVRSLASAFDNSNLIDSAIPSGPYLNLRIRSDVLFSSAFSAIQRKETKVENPSRIMVEYLSPNTNKPLHLGHVRNGVLGSALSNLLREVGHTVTCANLVNDRGIHICKSMLAYDLHGNGSTPISARKKSDHFVGDWYVRFAAEEKNDPTLQGRAEKMLRLWEAGDPAVRELWQRMNQWVYDGFAVTYARYGFVFDVTYYESDLYLLGKDIVHKGLDREVFEFGPDNSVIFQLDPEKFGLNADKLPKFISVLRPDGTSVYITQDIGTAVKKAEEHDLDRSIYVVACEQRDHFKGLFEILNALGYPWASQCFHLSYEMVELPEGKMKSREGKVVDADNLADDMSSLAAVAIKMRPENACLSEEETVRRADKIALAAIKFYLLRFNTQTLVCFDPKKSLSFEGDTGPYCLYTYARARSILEKAQTLGVPAFANKDFSILGNLEERALAIELLQLPNKIVRAAELYAPSLVAEQTLRIAKAFNRFYKMHPVLGDAEKMAGRVALVSAVSNALYWGLTLLGIDPIEKM